jgi:hypothetical protein
MEVKRSEVAEIVAVTVEAAAAAAATTYRRDVRVEFAVEKVQRVYSNQQRQQRRAVIQRVLHRVHAHGVTGTAKLGCNVSESVARELTWKDHSKGQGFCSGGVPCARAYTWREKDQQRAAAAAGAA